MTAMLTDLAFFTAFIGCAFLFAVALGIAGDYLIDWLQS